MKLKEFIELYAGDGVLMNLLSEDGMEYDTVPLDSTYSYRKYINNRWLNGKVMYFDYHDDEFYVSVDLNSDDGYGQKVNSTMRIRRCRSVMADSTRGAEASLYNRLEKAVPNPDTDIDTHESDLYVLKTPETTKILKDHYDRLGVNFQAETFRDQITHRTYYDVPFGYMNEFINKRRKGLD